MIGQFWFLNEKLLKQNWPWPGHKRTDYTQQIFLSNTNGNFIAKFWNVEFAREQTWIEQRRYTYEKLNAVDERKSFIYRGLIQACTQAYLEIQHVRWKIKNFV